jgi:hypothetical protein
MTKHDTVIDATQRRAYVQPGIAGSGERWSEPI